MKYTWLLWAFFSPFICASGLWSGINNEIMLNNQPVRVKGLNWYGFETTKRCIEGLWDHPIDYFLSRLEDNGFNALRVPISVEMILYDQKDILYEFIESEPIALNKTPMALLDVLFEETRQHNMLVLLDIHRLKYGQSSQLWYLPNNTLYTEDTLLLAIDTLIQRYHTFPNFFGIDLFNEPHGNATYGTGDWTDWRRFIEQAVYTIFPRYPMDSFFFFINGLDWGKDFSMYDDFNLYLPLDYASRIVMSPHVYGPTLVHIPSYKPTDLYARWDELFGYMIEKGYTLCIGEWGGRFNYKKEKLWLDIFSQYMIDRRLSNNFFWALNPYSMDVSGLMTNWTSFNTEKLNFLARVQPYPTFFHMTETDIFVV